MAWVYILGHLQELLILFLHLYFLGKKKKKQSPIVSYLNSSSPNNWYIMYHCARSDSRSTPRAVFFGAASFAPSSAAVSHPAVAMHRPPCCDRPAPRHAPGRLLPLRTLALAMHCPWTAATKRHALRLCPAPGLQQQRDRQGGRQGQAAAGDMQHAHAAGVSGGREVAQRRGGGRRKMLYGFVGAQFYRHNLCFWSKN